MSPAHERDHPTSHDASPRPGGGTYPVRPAVTAQHPEPPAPPKPGPVARMPVDQVRHTGSPRAFLTLTLLAFGLLTLVLLAVSLRGYLPRSGQEDAPPADSAPEAAPGP